MISKFFIDRPVFASVLSIVIVLAGLVAMRALPISQYPQIVPPEVVVSASYPGATAENIAATVAAPLEQQINGVERMIYMQSTSTGSGTMNLTVTFEIGTNPDQNAINVNNRVQRALPLLPGEVVRQGLVVQKRSTAILQVLTMSSPDGPNIGCVPTTSTVGGAKPSIAWSGARFTLVTSHRQLPGRM